MDRYDSYDMARQLTANRAGKGLVVRYFMGGYYLCTGTPPAGKENDGELYVGDTVKWFPTWDEADAMRQTISNCYQ
jgi:hypothetical protein